MRVLLVAAFTAVFGLSTEVAASNIRSNHSQLLKAPKSGARPAGKKEDEKPFSEMIKDKVAYKGLFTFYRDSLDNTILMAIKKDQFDKLFLIGETRETGDGAFAEGGLMNQTVPFCFKRVGKNVLMLEKNLRLTADTAKPIRNAVRSASSDGLVASTTVKSLPDTAGTILVDAMPLFVRDAENINFYLGQAGQTGISFDRQNSYFDEIKSFPLNNELRVRLHYKTSRPQGGDALQNPYSFYHTYHYSILDVPTNGYVPRLADDRMGHYLTLFQDYTKIDRETPYVRYISRWNLKKKNPEARVSEPVEPIVYWIDKAVPHEYRHAVARGIEYWQQCFEKIGFRNAIIAKQMPDTATWDPADIRYSVVRWSVTKNSPYTAIGPSRANPLTGEVFDADINFNVDAVRNAMLLVQRRIKPIGFDGIELPEPILPQLTSMKHDHKLFACQAAEEGAQMAAFGLAHLLTTADETVNKDSLTQEYVEDFISFIVAHEVGHTLCFRHNFRASSIHEFAKLNDRTFSSENGMIGTVMDYPAPNIAGVGRKQGEFYSMTAGPWDCWMIEYTYSDFGAKTPEEESEKLQAIADRAGDPLLAYATDEDGFGFSPRSVDPYTNWWDMGADPIEYFERNIETTRKIWFETIKQFEKPGRRYQDVQLAFLNGWQPYFFAVQTVPKFVGGLDHNRYHVGDNPRALPFKPISASEQRRAMAFLKQHIFASDAFDLPAGLLNKLQPEQFQDFTWSAGNIAQLDYPIHQAVLNIQNAALTKLYSPLTLNRLLNNLERVSDGEEKYTMYDLFGDVRKSIWSELDGTKSLNSFRRQLQLSHLNQLITISMSSPRFFASNAAVHSADAISLASNDLDIIRGSASRAASSSAVDGMTQAHYREVIRQIDAARSASREFN